MGFQSLEIDWNSNKVVFNKMREGCCNTVILYLYSILKIQEDELIKEVKFSAENTQEN
jgi:hypothetical protein